MHIIVFFNIIDFVSVLDYSKHSILNWYQIAYLFTFFTEKLADKEAKRKEREAKLKKEEEEREAVLKAEEELMTKLATCKWFEAKSPEGYSYYWNVETNGKMKWYLFWKPGTKCQSAFLCLHRSRECIEFYSFLSVLAQFFFL